MSKGEPPPRKTRPPSHRNSKTYRRKPILPTCHRFPDLGPRNPAHPQAHATNPEPGSSPGAATQPKAGNGFVPQNAQRTANQANAQHSTGPRTPEGKATSSQNALKHGLSIQRHAVLRDEDPEAYAQLLSALREIYEPRSRREDLAIEDIAQCRWAIQRIDEAESVCSGSSPDCWNEGNEEGDKICSAGASLSHAADVFTDFDRNDNTVVLPDTTYPTFDKIHRYRTHWERKQARALAEFDRAQRARHAEANQSRAEAQAQRQAEAHALKQELAIASERRRQELHDLRLAKLKVQWPPATKESGDSIEDAAMAYLKSLAQRPRSHDQSDSLRTRAAQASNGFVSQNGTSRKPAA
ncbi:MAG: hypothetical protein U5J83_05295 [Bryobacterales bacterium]|nr:hypothetical protein [Bryobacterales bacterium]